MTFPADLMRSKFGKHMYRSRCNNVQEILGAIGEVGENGACRRVSRSRFFSVSNTRWLRQLSQRPIFSKFGHDAWIHACILETHRKWFLKIFCLKDICLPQKKTSKLKGSNGRLSQTSLEPMRRAADRCCSLHVVVQGSGSFPTPVNVRLRTS